MTEQTDDYDEELDEVLCICSGTTKRKVLQLIDNGVDTLDGISRKTGAHSGCGGCEYELELIIEEYNAAD
jgi:bacterioferritin-associated ferredoxin